MFHSFQDIDGTGCLRCYQGLSLFVLFIYTKHHYIVQYSQLK